MKQLKYFRLLILISFYSGLFPLHRKAQIESFNYSENKKLNVYPSDQPFASYWFPLEILSWSPSTDPDAP